ncbi:16S rRNA processing protein RimM [[Eubacterium] yurii subsp. margaretiae ATCC 43715]|nr:16S rRNA processing protein RimM [[Eubacterium] yurii subsp. margaretiae ATCC 43715]
MPENKRIRIGKIVKTQGLKGEFKIYPYTTDSSSFSSYKNIYVDGVGDYSFEYVRQNNNVLIAKFKGLNSIDDLPALINKDIFIDYSEKRQMEEGEYLISELIGLKVYDGENLIGEIKDVLLYGANDVFCVIDMENNERLIPNVRQFVKNIDIENKKVIVNLIKGM